MLPPPFQVPLPIEVEPDERLSDGLETTGAGWVAVTGAATTGASAAGAGVTFVSTFAAGAGAGAGAGAAGAETITGGAFTTGVITLGVLPWDEPDGVEDEVVVVPPVVVFVCTTGVVPVGGVVTTGVVVAPVLELLVRVSPAPVCWVKPVPLDEPPWPVCTVPLFACRRRASSPERGQAGVSRPRAPAQAQGPPVV